MRRIFLALVLILTVRPLFADTHTAASCSYADVSAAITAASAGDTVSVPAGSATWSSRIFITTGIYLIGAGIGNTIITNEYDLSPEYYVITYQPSNPASNESFRVSGFTINCTHTSGGIGIRNFSDSVINKVRIDHNEVHKETYGRCINIDGNVNGVCDNNTLYSTGVYAVSIYGHNESSWTNRTFTPGTADNFFVEDNTITVLDGGSAGGGGGRYCIRYNTWTFASTEQGCQPWFDAHGNMGAGGNLASMGAEIYENTITLGNQTCTMFDIRGGEAIAFNNSTTSTAGVGMQIREEHNDNLNPPVTASDGEPQYPSDCYFWNNTRNGAKILTITVVETIDYGGEIGIVPREDAHYWLEKTSFDGSSGAGVGLLSARPSSGLTVGVGYWATDTSMLYRATGATTWGAYYTPYTYPHPLRGEEGSNVPAKIGAGTTITVGPGAKIVIKEEK